MSRKIINIDEGPNADWIKQVHIAREGHSCADKHIPVHYFQQLAAEFHRNGYVVARQLISELQVKAMVRAVDEVIARAAELPEKDVYYEDTATGEPPAIKSLFCLEIHSSHLAKVEHHPQLIGLMQAIYPATEILPKGVFFFGKPAFSGSVTPPHQDNAFQNLEPPEAVVCTISLDASTPENGALTCRRGSHLLGRLRHQPSGVKGFSQTLVEEVDDTLYPPEQLCLQPGDVALHHTNTIHGSGANSTPYSRRQLAVQYHTARARRDEAAWAMYQAQLQELLGGTP